ncbi:MAG TPA: hypothetical protein VNT53_03860 [Pseudolysinimonas sp.]|nr:hypothetical protein [Pseudolysinimonas sp.]
MRWENLFDDLESQLAQELGADEVEILAEEERLRVGRLALRDRIRSMMQCDDTLMLDLIDGQRIPLHVRTVARDWIAGEISPAGSRRGSCVVPIASIAAVTPGSEQLMMGLAAPPTGEPTDLSLRLGLSFVLRDLCRRRATIEVRTRSGHFFGTIDRVGRDHFDLAEHDPASPRHNREVTAIRILSTSELALIRF